MGDERRESLGIVLSALAVTSKELEQLCASRTPSTYRLLNSLAVDGVDLPFDDQGERWFCSMPQGVDDAWDPVVRWIGEMGVWVAMAPVGVTRHADDGARTMRVVAYTDTQWYECELVLTSLPILVIDVIGGAVPTGFTRSTKTPVGFSLHDNRGSSVEVVSSAATMRVRGSASTFYPKKGFRVELRSGHSERARNSKVSLLGMRKDDDWILYASYSDEEKVRNVFSSNLWYDSCAENNGWDVAAGSQYRFVELLLGGSYWGLYALGFPVDAKQVGLNRTEGWLFKKSAWNRSEMRPWMLESGDMELREGFEISEGEASEDAWTALRRFFTTLIADPRRLRALADYQNACDLWLFLNFSGAVDNIGKDENMKNMYIALRPSARGHVGALYVPWDLDLTWGDMWDAEEDNYIRTMGVSSTTRLREYPCTVSRMRATGDAIICDVLAARWKELREQLWSDEALERRLSELETSVFASGAFERDRTRWPKGNYTVRGDASQMRSWMLARAHVMDQWLAPSRGASASRIRANEGRTPHATV